MRQGNIQELRSKLEERRSIVLRTPEAPTETARQIQRQVYEYPKHHNQFRISLNLARQ